MVAVDEHDARTDSQKRATRRLFMLREVRGVSCEFDNGTQ